MLQASYYKQKAFLSIEAHTPNKGDSVTKSQFVIPHNILLQTPLSEYLFHRTLPICSRTLCKFLQYKTTLSHRSAKFPQLLIMLI